MYRIKSLLYGIVTLPLSIVSFVSSFLVALMVVLDKPIRAAFGMKEEYNNGLNGIVDMVNALKDALEFD